MKPHEALKFLKDNQDTLLSEKHSIEQRDQIEFVFESLQGSVNEEVIRLIFSAIKKDSDVDLLQNFPTLFEDADKSIVIESIINLLLSDCYHVASTAVLLAIYFPSEKYLESLLKFISRDDGTVTGVESAIEIISDIEDDYSLTGWSEKAIAALPSWFYAKQRERDLKLTKYQLERAMTDASTALMKKNYKEALRILSLNEEILDSKGLIRLAYAKKMLERFG